MAELTKTVSAGFFLVLVACAVVLAGELSAIGSPDLSSSTYAPPATIPVSVGRLTADYVKELPAYIVEFKAEPADYGVEFTAYDAPLRFMPAGLVADGVRIAPSLQPRLTSEKNVEYPGVFGDGIDISYEMEDNRLKESIILRDEGVLPSSSTMSIDFILTYPDYVIPTVDGVEWSGEIATTGNDIVFVRRKEPHKLYAVNRFYKIKAPYLNDSEGHIIDLTYTLAVVGNQTVLRLNLPVLDSVNYPVVVDPTIEWVDNDGFRTNWENRMNCSSNTNACTTIISSPPYITFHVSGDCNDGSPINEPVRKGLFEFDITSLYEYYGTLYDARVWTKGSCDSNNLMPPGYDVYLFHIDEFSTSVTCGDHADNQGVVWLRRMMNQTTCPGSTKDDTYITSDLQDSLDASDDYFALKLDITPELESTQEPNNPYEFLMNTNDLELEYYFTCDYSTDCPTTEFCNWSGTDHCSVDLSYGKSCENVATDDDDYACANNNCQQDDFDGSGKYCAEASRCVHDGNRYTTGSIHCAGDQSYYKTCQANTQWTSQTNCSYGCNEGSGCATTTTTTITTTTTTDTTTTSTTLAPNIIITPETLTHRRNV